MNLASRELDLGLSLQHEAGQNTSQNQNLRQKLGRLAFGSAASFLTVAALAPTAFAGSLVGDTSDSPFAGQGTIGTTSVSGLGFTRGMEGDHFDRALKSSKGNHAWGELLDKLTSTGQCTFLDTDMIDGLSNDPPEADNICRSYLYIKDDTSEYAKGINRCDDGVGKKCVDGVKEPLTPECNDKLYYKFAPAEQGFDNLDYPEHGSGPFRYAGKAGDYVYYRWTRKVPDDKGQYYAYVRDDKYGWVWIRKNCIKGYPQGGPPKTQDTVPGPNPNNGKTDTPLASSATSAGDIKYTLVATPVL